MRYDHRDAIDVRRLRAADDAEHVAERYRMLLEVKADQLEGDAESLSKTSAKDLALAYAIARDKSSNLRGDATVIVEGRKGMSLDEAAAMIEAAQKRVRGTAIDVEASDA
jgi:hypothetical protein